MVLTVGEMSLPLEETPAGPLLATDYERDDPRATLAWVMDVALTGGLPDFEETILKKGELFKSQGMAVGPVAPEEISPKDELKWLRVGKTPLEGDDIFLLTTTFTDASLMVPGKVLLELFRKLTALRTEYQRSHPMPAQEALPAAEPQAPPATPAPRRAEFVELEQRAVALDALARKDPKTPEEAVDESVKRRFLLLDLDAAGVLTDERAEELRMHLEAWVLPTLLGYQRAAMALLDYLRAPGRKRYIKNESGPARVLGARVSVDWFRLGVPTPSLFEPVNWLGFCERILLEGAPGWSGAGTGTLFTRAGEGSCSIDWRADDGQTPAVLSAHYSG